MVLYFDEFTEGESVGGATGSVRAKLKGWNWQVKKSILDAPLSRRTKAGGLDKENYAEHL